jgi:hypothetical protein
MVMTQYDFDVFISYAQCDVAFARDLAIWLRKCDIRVWLAEEQLVPGSRFRAGLEQGIRECRDLVAVLTPAYSARPWTQREVDLFDLDANLSQRRVIGLQIGEYPPGPIDQVFLVSQRINWRDMSLDHDGFWLLHCGINRTRPGPRSDWASNGARLLSAEQPRPLASSSSRTTRSELRVYSLDNYDLGKTDGETYVSLVDKCLCEKNQTWHHDFSRLEKLLESRSVEAVAVLTDLWAFGHPQRAAVIYAALRPTPMDQYGPWSLLDSGCQSLARWVLISRLLRTPDESEIWFSWAVSDGAWSFLPEMAELAPVGPLQEHFRDLASKAADPSHSFRTTEADYDYGVMITPWNHFHLCWLALRLADHQAAIAHADALCRTALRGDVRAGRFLSRVCSWPVYQPVLADAPTERMITRARESLGMLPLAAIGDTKRRLEEIWSRSR